MAGSGREQAGRALLGCHDAAGVSKGSFGLQALVWTECTARAAAAATIKRGARAQGTLQVLTLYHWFL